MRTALTFLIGIVVSSSAAQNLVPNGSFEINTGCPNQIGQVDLADGWVNWGVTPDYFHACSNSTSPLYGTPTNVRGFQIPHTGFAYMGLFTVSVPFPNMREFIGRELSQPLTIGTTYFVSLWVSRAGQVLASHASDNIGVRFTTVSNFSIADPDTALNNAMVFASTVITDSIDWVQVTGSFVADSAYTHIGVGNYFDDASTTVIAVTGSNYAYYLIDDVCVSVDPAFCSIETALDELPVNSFSIFPNPVKETLYLQTHEKLECNVNIRTILGASVHNSRLNLDAGETGSIELNFLPAGIYILEITNSSSTSFRKVIIY